MYERFPWLRKGVRHVWSDFTPERDEGLYQFDIAEVFVNHRQFGQQVICSVLDEDQYGRVFIAAYISDADLLDLRQGTLSFRSALTNNLSVHVFVEDYGVHNRIELFDFNVNDIPEQMLPVAGHPLYRDKTNGS